LKEGGFAQGKNFVTRKKRARPLLVLETHILGVEIAEKHESSRIGS